MTNLEMVEKLMEKADVTYEEAKTALEIANWDMLDALVDLERQGKVKRGQKMSWTESTANAEDASYRTVEATASRGETDKKKFQYFIDEVKSILSKSIDNSFVIRKNDKEVASIPILIALALLLFAFWVTLPLLIIGIFFGFRYSFRGDDLGKSEFNQAMDKAADMADDAVEKYRRNHEQNSGWNSGDGNGTV